MEMIRMDRLFMPLHMLLIYNNWYKEIIFFILQVIEIFYEWLKYVVKN